MEFAAFADRAAEIEAEAADLAITDHVTALLAESGADLPVVARFVQGRVFADHADTKLDIGPSSCYEAIARAAETNVTAADVEARLAEVGDVGAVASSYDLGGQQGLAAFTGGGGRDGVGSGGDLTVAGVAEELVALAVEAGSGSRDRKVTRLFRLFNRCSPEEARYLARLVLSEMRIGVGEGTVRDAIAAAFEVPVGAVERAIQVRNDFGEVALVARDEGADGLDALELEVGRPVKAMLAQAGTVTEALDDWEFAAVEWKYDGARVQLHHDGETVRVFSRNLEDVTDALPEVVAFAEDHVRSPAILDGEVVAVDDDGEPLPFQEVLRRFRRKHDVERAAEEVAVELRLFDCLHAPAEPDGRQTEGGAGDETPAGEDLLDEALVDRHDRLERVAGADIGDLLVTADPEEIAGVESDALDAGHEGIMLKNPVSAYTPGRRGKQWQKCKPDVETLDLVVAGAEWGEGRRASRLGTFLLAARDGDTYETIGKVATGITDDELAALTDLLEAHVRSQDGQVVDLEPAVVFEVGYEEIQRSPTYSSGYALRFPRFVGVRSDKNPADADSLARVERLAGE